MFPFESEVLSCSAVLFPDLGSPNKHRQAHEAFLPGAADRHPARLAANGGPAHGCLCCCQARQSRCCCSLGTALCSSRWWWQGGALVVQPDISCTGHCPFCQEGPGTFPFLTPFGCSVPVHSGLSMHKPAAQPPNAPQDLQEPEGSSVGFQRGGTAEAPTYLGAPIEHRKNLLQEGC